MTRFDLIRTKNAMLLANIIANVIGVSVVLFLTHRSGPQPAPDMAQLGFRINIIYIPCAFIVPMVLTLIYERPVRQFLNYRYSGDPAPEEVTNQARHRLLNEPFFLIGLDLGVWFAAAVLYSTVFWAFGTGQAMIKSVFLRSFNTGLITTTTAFFVFEFVMQRKVVPYVFPEGRLYMTPGTVSISIRTRLIALLFACNLVPFFSILINIWETSQTNHDLSHILEQWQSAIFNQAIIFMVVGIWLTFLVSGNIRRPLQEIISVLQEVRHGRFDKKVIVTSNDEIGYTGDVINEMTEGLKERDFVKETFGKYVTSEIRDEILSGRVSLDGEIKNVTVLFADLRDFTPMVETTPPKQVVKIINSYFKEMDEAIKQYHGLVLQYIGDEIEAVFGAPVFREDHPVMAVKARP